MVDGSWTLSTESDIDIYLSLSHLGLKSHQSPQGQDSRSRDQASERRIWSEYAAALLRRADDPGHGQSSQYDLAG